MGNYLLRAWPVRTRILASMAEFRTLCANPFTPRSKETEGRTTLNTTHTPFTKPTPGKREHSLTKPSKKDLELWLEHRN